ncbi:MAG TPA: hypothetical protein VLF90_01490 [Patescibacteria group bacterium]|nr:hypothetical protein [Patescibacteria group bacterium]
MNKKRLGMTLLPSMLSGIIVMVLTPLILLGGTWSQGLGKGLLYDFLFGSNSSAELIQTSKGSFAAFGNTVFGNPLLNKVLFFVFWMLVGLIVYVLLHGFLRGVSTAAEEVEESQYVNADKAHNIKHLEVRAAVRLVVLAAWILYSVVFIKILLPFSVLVVRLSISGQSQGIGWLYALSGVITLILSLHLHVIWLRLFTLRVRVFGTS